MFKLIILLISAWMPTLAATEGISTKEQHFDDVAHKLTYPDGCAVYLQLTTEYVVTGLSIDTASANADHTTFGDHVTAFYRDATGHRVSIDLGSVSLLVFFQ